eukprot:gnl/TRDRNA2_/TRDRNA2_156915_c0_seq1.p2 gnl/TRDRNA2_/TRDRNA2_156915_c0~~gnl/TRDRNA2_/TRDRNA2_156915_c0_seq1.p2  ORF type:complete len:185 (-),score=9.41 gnl/TRDRNA2_/TRDRNA2_156915_c0_seq1:9-563(-)
MPRSSATCFSIHYRMGIPAILLSKLLIVVVMCQDRASICFYLQGQEFFFQLGRTLAVLTHRDAWGSLSHGQGAGGSGPALLKPVATAARKAGYDSIQFMNHYIGGGPPSVYEIVDLKSVNDKLKVAIDGHCPRDQTAYRGGWGGRRACECRKEFQFLQCRHTNITSFLAARPEIREEYIDHDVV